MNSNIDSMEIDLDGDRPVKGTNFLVSAIMILKRQRKDLESELNRLKERVSILESQNAALVNVGADRLLQTRG